MGKKLVIRTGGTYKLHGKDVIVTDQPDSKTAYVTHDRPFSVPKKELTRGK